MTAIHYVTFIASDNEELLHPASGHDEGIIIVAILYLQVQKHFEKMKRM